MCVKIIREEGEFTYNPAKPLEDQLRGSSEVVVNYQPYDKSIDKFMEEMQKFAKMGVSTAFNIKVVHNDHISGASIKKNLKKAINDITLNEIIKVMVLSHTEMDQKLEELANCFVGVKKKR